MKRRKLESGLPVATGIVVVGIIMLWVLNYRIVW